MTDFEMNSWKCPLCGHENRGAFCTECGAPKPVAAAEKTMPEAVPAETQPVRMETPAAETEIRTAAPAPEPAPEPVKPVPAYVPETPKKNAARTKKSHPVLTVLLAGLLGLAGGYGGSLLALRGFVPAGAVPEQAAEETAEAVPEAPAPAETPAAAPAPAAAVSSGKTLQEVAETASKTVVEIQTENTVTSYGLFGGTYTSTAAGSGVIISDDGYIITNNHVVEDSQKISVKTYSGENYDAELIGTDAKSDIAVIKIDATGLDAAVLGDSDQLRVGDTAIVIGNPLGTLGGTVTNGIISATNRDMVINNQSMNLIQTNAAINSGNSGGGLFDGDGKLIGIVNAKDSGMTSNGTVIEGLGFAIPINTAYQVATELMENGYVTTRPTIGIGLSTLDSDYGEYKAGLYITQVYEGSGAADAGLQEYDRITAVDGTELSTYTELSKILATKKVGDVIKIDVEREGEPMQFDVTLTGPLESMLN